MDFHFLRPEWFLVLLPLLWLVWMFHHKQLMNRDWASIIDPNLLPYLLSGEKGQSSKLPFILLTLMAVLLTTALAGPVWKKIPVPVFEQQSALIILLDLSSSMDATDIKPSRLARARLKLQDLLKLRKEGQTALIAYAANAYAVSPLTDDTDTIQSMIVSLATDIMPSQGSRPENAVKKAIQLFKNAAVTSGDMLIMTDGLSELSLEAIQSMSLQGHRLSVIGVGTSEGAPIADRDGGFIKDSQGSIVVAKTDQRMLQQLAISGGGVHSPMTIDESDLQKFDSFMTNRLNMPENQASEFTADRWDEVGPWILLIVVPFAALAFRRGIILSLALLILVPFPQDSIAQSWLDDSGINNEQLWLNKNQQARKKLEQGDAEAAASLFQQQDWKAAALYRSGQYQQALDKLKQDESVKGRYNRANTLAHLGQFEEAIKTYDRILQQNPDHEDAQFNRQQVEQALKQQQQQDKQQSDQQKNDQSDQQEKQDGGKSDDSDSSGQQSSDEKNQKNDSNNQSSSAAENNDQESEQQQAEDQLKSEQEKQQQEKEMAESKEAQQSDEESQQSAEEKTESMTEQAQAQWLRRIPDNPGGLLRNKFRYQYSRQQPPQPEKEPW